MSKKTKFNLIVSFHGGATFDRDVLTPKLKEIAQHPVGPCNEPMYCDTMEHELVDVHYDFAGDPHVRVELGGVGITGDEAAMVSAATVRKMEETIIEHAGEDQHLTTAYSSDTA